VSVTNDVVFASALDGELFALRASDGRELWSFQANIQLTAPDGSAVQGGTLDSVGAFCGG
jgi:polyvinyl alcohol dehydrogenase (cytochrome)